MEDTTPLWKPSPNNSGQATKLKARRAERKGRGKLRHPKELLLSSFPTKAIVATRASGLQPEAVPSRHQVLLETVILISNGRAHSHIPDNTAVLASPEQLGRGALPAGGIWQKLEEPCSQELGQPLCRTGQFRMSEPLSNIYLSLEKSRQT